MRTHLLEHGGPGAEEGPEAVAPLVAVAVGVEHQAVALQLARARVCARKMIRGGKQRGEAQEGTDGRGMRRQG